MSIGKVDCTVETALCKRHNVKGYPTLKYIRNGGTAQDYTSGRDADSIIEFADAMTRPALTLVETSYDEGVAALLAGSHPVAYVMHDPDVDDPTSIFVNRLIDNSGASEEERRVMKVVKATARTREYEHVADRLRARASFGLIHPTSVPHDEIRKFFTSHTTTTTATTNATTTTTATTTRHRFLRHTWGDHFS